jgi:fructose-1-phosphate kinase PfkB-like protein
VREASDHQGIVQNGPGRLLIATVTPNPAWDVTYEVPALVPGEVHRVTRVHRRLGGKGVNVARVLHAGGHDAVAIIPGPAGLAAEAGLPEARLPEARADRSTGRAGDADGPRLACDVVPGPPAIRQTLVIAGGDGVTTSLWEPGAEPDPGTARALSDRVGAWLGPDGQARGLVVSGSLPPGLDARLPAGLATVAIGAGLPAVIDTSGAALHHAASVRGAVLTPNAFELSQLTGRDCHDLAEATGAAGTLLAGGLLAVVVTLGEGGLVAVTRNGTWHGRLAEPLAGNPTGAGDAAAAALIAGLAAAADWPRIVADAVATSAAAVLSPIAGDVAPADVARLRRHVEVREVA